MSEDEVHTYSITFSAASWSFVREKHSHLTFPAINLLTVVVFRVNPVVPYIPYH